MIARGRCAGARPLPSLRILGVGLVLLQQVGCGLHVSVSSAPTVVPVGSTVILHQPLEIPPGTARVTLQHGRVSHGASEWDPACQFTVDAVSDGWQRIEPDRFRVIAFAQRRLPYGLGARGLRFAALGGGGFFGGGLFDASRRVVYLSFMRLRSAVQPQVRALECRITSDSLGGFLTLEQIREALGETASLQFPSQPSGRGTPVPPSPQ